MNNDLWELLWKAARARDEREALQAVNAYEKQKLEKAKQAQLEQERIKQAEVERQAREAEYSIMRAGIKQGQERQREQGLDYWISDITDAETRKELKLLLIETKRAFLS